MRGHRFRGEGVTQSSENLLVNDEPTFILGCIGNVVVQMLMEGLIYLIWL